MIPKVIHFCWLSDDAYPYLIEKCIKSWKNKLPDYEFIHWDTNNFDVESTIWTQQAFNKKKYAFVADYIRLYGIYKYGGIYLDTDVEVLKNFDNLLSLPYFIGYQYDNFIEAAVFGAEKESEWVLDCMKYYENRSFIKEDGQLDLLILPQIMQSQIEKKRKIVPLNYNEIGNISKLIENKNLFFVYPSDFFSPKNHQTNKISKSKNTYTIHHYNNSWLSFLSRLRLKLVHIIGIKNAEKAIGLFKLRKLFQYLKSFK